MFLVLGVRYGVLPAFWDDLGTLLGLVAAQEELLRRGGKNPTLAAMLAIHKANTSLKHVKDALSIV